MGKKRTRADSPVRVQVSRPRVAASEEPPQPTQVNTHVHVGIDTSIGGPSRSRQTVRTEHVTRVLQSVDLSRFLAEEQEGDLLIDADEEFNTSYGEDVSHIALGFDEEVVEDPEASVTAGEQVNDSRRPVSTFFNHTVSLANQLRQVRVVQDWIPHRQTYLDELLRIEGLGEANQPPNCPCCPPESAREGKFKCEDCFGGALLCEQCIVGRHNLLPLHRILVSPIYSTSVEKSSHMLVQSWTGVYFAKTSLYNLRLRVYLGHEGQPCPRAYKITDGFTLVDTTGIHTLKVVFCGCDAHPPQNIQLLRARWFPASMISPRSAFTFEVLNMFHVVNAQGKLSLYHFYNAIHRISDNAGIRDLKVSQTFLRWAFSN